MNTMRTLIQLTTTATLAACLQVNVVGTANAARLASNSTSNFTKASSTGESPTPSTPRVWTVAQTSRFPNDPKEYEPPPNGNPESDGTGTR
ncbi:hypothetical protein NDA07_02430 [Microcoleus vaginatus DQ-U2]|uniref:hypothetical protein n=1 Tax=Microcoleus vaginatus TaxID=119532 RepID=UPI0032A73395